MLDRRAGITKKLQSKNRKIIFFAKLLSIYVSYEIPTRIIIDF
jgi:hypothetical protein